MKKTKKKEVYVENPKKEMTEEEWKDLLEHIQVLIELEKFLEEK